QASRATRAGESERASSTKSMPAVLSAAGPATLQRLFHHPTLGGCARPFAEEQQLPLAGDGHHPVGGLELVAVADHVGATNPRLLVEHDAARVEIAGVVLGQLGGGRGQLGVLPALKRDHDRDREQHVREDSTPGAAVGHAANFARLTPAGQNRLATTTLLAAAARVREPVALDLG